MLAHLTEPLVAGAYDAAFPVPCQVFGFAIHAFPQNVSVKPTDYTPLSISGIAVIHLP